jgi:hypothetical protein
MKKRILSLVVLCAVLVSCCVPAFAAESSTDSVGSSITQPQRRHFSRTFEAELNTTYYKEVFNDPNWGNDKILTITTLSLAPGMSDITYYVYRKQNGESDWVFFQSAIVIGQSSATFFFPEDSDWDFKIYARAFGADGWVTGQVSLADQ